MAHLTVSSAKTWALIEEKFFVFLLDYPISLSILMNWISSFAFYIQRLTVTALLSARTTTTKNIEKKRRTKRLWYFENIWSSNRILNSGRCIIIIIMVISIIVSMKSTSGPIFMNRRQYMTHSTFIHEYDKTKWTKKE